MLKSTCSDKSDQPVATAKYKEKRTDIFRIVNGKLVIKR
jgi:hypothetical protein